MTKQRKKEVKAPEKKSNIIAIWGINKTNQKSSADCWEDDDVISPK